MKIMKFSKKNLIVMLLGVFVIAVPVFASAPKMIVHEGNKVVLNDEYLKELPQDELTEMLNTILPHLQKEQPRVVVHEGNKVVLNDEYLKRLSQDELTEMLNTVFDEALLSYAPNK